MPAPAPESAPRPAQVYPKVNLNMGPTFVHKNMRYDEMNEAEKFDQYRDGKGRGCASHRTHTARTLHAHRLCSLPPDDDPYQTRYLSTDGPVGRARVESLLLTGSCQTQTHLDAPRATPQPPLSSPSCFGSQAAPPHLLFLECRAALPPTNATCRYAALAPTP